MSRIDAWLQRTNVICRVGQSRKFRNFRPFSLITKTVLRSTTKLPAYVIHPSILFTMVLAIRDWKCACVRVLWPYSSLIERILSDQQIVEERLNGELLCWIYTSMPPAFPTIVLFPTINLHCWVSLISASDRALRRPWWNNVRALLSPRLKLGTCT